MLIHGGKFCFFSDGVYNARALSFVRSVFVGSGGFVGSWKVEDDATTARRKIGPSGDAPAGLARVCHSAAPT